MFIGKIHCIVDRVFKNNKAYVCVFGLCVVGLILYNYVTRGLKICLVVGIFSGYLCFRIVHYRDVTYSVAVVWWTLR